MDIVQAYQLWRKASKDWWQLSWPQPEHVEGESPILRLLEEADAERDGMDDRACVEGVG